MGAQIGQCWRFFYFKKALTNCHLLPGVESLPLVLMLYILLYIKVEKFMAWSHWSMAVLTLIREIKAIVQRLVTTIFAWQQINIFRCYCKGAFQWRPRALISKYQSTLDHKHGCGGRMLSLSAFVQLSGSTTIDTFELIVVMTSQILTWWIMYSDF